MTGEARGTAAKSVAPASFSQMHNWRAVQTLTAFGPEKVRGPVATDPLRRPLEGGVWGNVRVAFGDARVEPLLYLLQQPRDPVLAKPNPLGKLPGRFEPRDVLGRIGNATDRP